MVDWNLGQVGPRPVPDGRVITYLAQSRSRRITKRIVDIVLAGLGLLLTAPLFAVIAVAIKLDSRGPVFFRQTRLGLHRRPFRMWKFRKMREDLPTQGPMVTTRYDVRMTRVGRVLERLKLDELPQLFDVLRGTMSVVGPRPDVPKFQAYYPELWDQVLSVKPGIFGASQNAFRNESELYPTSGVGVEEFYVENILPKMLELDAEYAHENGFLRDMALLFGGVFVSVFGAITVKTVVTRRAQIGNFLILSIAGVAGMFGAIVLAGESPAAPVVAYTLALAAIAKPVALLALQVPKSMATSMTPDDYRRLLWCGLGSSAVILFGTEAAFAGETPHMVIIADAAFFLATLFTYKLFLYALQLTFFIQASRVMTRRMIWAAAVLAPASVALTVMVRHGSSAWSGPGGAGFAAMLLLAPLVRPATLLLYRPLQPTPSAVTWITGHFVRTAAATLVGSSILVMGALVFDRTSIGLGDSLFDAALYTVLISLAAIWQGSRLNRGADLATADAERRPLNLLVVGSDIELSSYVAALDSFPDGDYEIAGIVTPRQQHRMSTIGGHPVVGEVADLPTILRSGEVDQLILLGSSLTEDDRSLAQAVADEAGVELMDVRLLPRGRDDESRLGDVGVLRPAHGPHRIGVPSEMVGKSRA